MVFDSKRRIGVQCGFARRLTSISTILLHLCVFIRENELSEKKRLAQNKSEIDLQLFKGMEVC